MGVQYRPRAAQSKPARAVSGGADGLRVLVVDDEPSICSLLRDVLAGEGHDVAAFSDAEEAIAGAEGEDYAVVLLDVMMPGMNGQQVLGALQARLPRATFVMMTGYPDSALATTCLNGGAMLCLPKPIHLSSLLDLISSIARERAA